MTEQQKESLIAKMLDAPSSLSDEELEIILDDDEMRDIYEISSAVSGSMCRPHTDMDEEWQLFRRRVRPKPSPLRWMARVAAIFLGVMFVSSIAVKMIDRVFTPEDTPVIARAERPVAAERPAQTAPTPETPDISDSPVQPAAPQPVIRKPKRHAAKPAATVSEIQPERIAEEIDIDEYLRIQQARVDNDIALQSAEVIKDEYRAIAGVLDAIGEQDEDIDEIITKITIQ